MNSNIHLIIQYAILFTSSVAGIVAWVSKIKWSKEFSSAKEAQINALKEMVNFYKDIISSNLIKFQKEEILHLGEVLEKQSKAIQEKDKEIQDNAEKIKILDLKMKQTQEEVQNLETVKNHQNQLEEQSNLLKELADNLKEANELLMQKQMLIQLQSIKLQDTNVELSKHADNLELKNSILEEKILQYEGIKKMH